MEQSWVSYEMYAETRARCNVLKLENAALKDRVAELTSTNNAMDAICPKCGWDTSQAEQTVLRSCGGCGITYAVKRHQ